MLNRAVIDGDNFELTAGVKHLCACRRSVFRVKSDGVWRTGEAFLVHHQTWLHIMGQPCSFPELIKNGEEDDLGFLGSDLDG